MPRGKGVDVYKDSRPRKKVDKWERMGHREDGPKVSWMDCDAEGLLAAVAAVTEGGAALLLATTSDGGALSIQVLNGGGRHKLYPCTVTELHEAIALIEEIAKEA